MNRVLALIFVLFFSACAAHRSLEPHYSEEMARRELAETLNNYIKAYEAKDAEKVLAAYAKDSELVVFGTDERERIVGFDRLAKEVKKSLAVMSKIQVKAHNRTVGVSMDGRSAWVSELWDVTFQKGKSKVTAKNVRNTMTLERRGGNWIIVQAHSSVGLKNPLVKH